MCRPGSCRKCTIKNGNRGIRREDCCPHLAPGVCWQADAGSCVVPPTGKSLAGLAGKLPAAWRKAGGGTVYSQNHSVVCTVHTVVCIIHSVVYKNHCVVLRLHRGAAGFSPRCRKVCPPVEGGFHRGADSGGAGVCLRRRPWATSSDPCRVGRR